MSKPNGILAMNPEKYREIDGVVFDEASYARHCQPKTEEAPAPETAPEASEPAQSAAPAPVFTADPYPECIRIASLQVDATSATKILYPA